MESVNFLDIAPFIIFSLIAVSSKDKVISGIAYIYSFIHLYNMFYDPSNWIDLCIESSICLLLGIFIISQSIRTWAVSLAVILIMSIALIFLEFIDYFMFNSYLQATYLQWIYATTALEIIILTLASNGLLHTYSNDFWHDIHRIVSRDSNKISIK